MPLKTVLYVFFLLATLCLSVFKHPVFGVYGYLLSYNLDPLSYWWSGYIPSFLTRYAYLFGLATFIGFCVHFSKLRFNRWFESQEIFFFIFVLIIYLSNYIGVNIDSETNAVKMLKVFFIIFLASHIVVDYNEYNIMTWIYVLSALYSAYEISFSGNLSYSTDGRLNVGRGGSDFSEGNFLAAHFLLVSPWVGVKFLKGNIYVKAVCIITGAVVANSFIVINSRGAFLGILAGVIFSVIISQKKYRKKIIVLLVIAGIGFFYVANDKFWNRMETIETNREEMGGSASGRIEAWTGAVKMFSDYPFGVGEGKFKSLIGYYNPSIPGKDTHSTFFRCIAELGIQGITLMMIMIFNSFRMLSKISNKIKKDEKLFDKYALEVLSVRLSLIMFLVATIFLSHTYIEEFYWLLMLPVFLKRCLENTQKSES